jgi:hypothetical protein
VRLATVEKVLIKAQHPTKVYEACIDFYDCKTVDYPPYAECLHVLLRDGIGHAEPSAGTKWEQRQTRLRNLCLAPAYEMMTRIEHGLRVHLQVKHEIEAVRR